MIEIPAAARDELTPTGKLRAGINYGNFILAAKDKVTGEPSGVAIDLLRDIAHRLNVSVEIIDYDSPAVMGEAAPTNAWDIAFLGSAPQREKFMNFTRAYLEIDATYLVPGDSPFKTAAEVDRDGIRISAYARANFELFLKRNLKHAHLTSTQKREEAFELLAAGKVDALADLTQGLLNMAPKLPGSRVLDGRFMGVQQSVAVPKGRDSSLAYLSRVVEEAKRSGLVARGIARLGVQGVSVAPLAE